MNKIILNFKKLITKNVRIPYVIKIINIVINEG